MIPFQLIAILGAVAAPHVMRRLGAMQPGAAYATARSSHLLAMVSNRNIRPMSEGKIADMHFTALATNEAQGILLRIELPFAVNTHLVNIPKGNMLQTRPLPRRLEQVSLEGNYNNTFDLYCEPGHQTTARYILDPKAMAFVLDFCQGHAWEIIDSELYLLSDTTIIGDQSSANMVSSIEQFVQQVRPALERPLTAQELARITPYGRERRSSLRCPVCRAKMPHQGTHFTCPEHGVLLTGRELIRLRDSELTIRHEAADVNTPADRRLHCPSCGDNMSLVQYNSGSISIDSCPSCPYRWLDGGEIHAISAAGATPQ